jgi:hypothetical protein
MASQYPVYQRATVAAPWSIMVRRHKPASRSPRYPARWPFVPLWCLGLLASLAVLVELGYLIGRDKPEHPKGVPDGVLLAAARPGVAIAIAFGALVLLAWCSRRLALHALAWWPGGIHVEDFATSARGVNAEELTTTFRQRLATMQLQSPTPVPGAPPASDFLNVLDRNGVDPRNILGSLLSLLRAAVPTHAYEVHGILLKREERPHYGVAIDVVRLPSNGVMAATVWGETWERALRHAANEATGAILPQTRRCRAPWGVWRGQIMPPGLLHAYEEGARLEHGHRYDEALEAYYDALKLDPMNMVLRLRIGQLQERLGLHLDALAMYLGMLASDQPAGVRLPRLMYRGRGRRERRRALHSARYRLDVLLGGRVLAEQWHRAPDDPPSRRDDHRKRLRRCLHGQLAAKLSPHATTGEDVGAALGEPGGTRQFLQLRTLMARYALADAADLRRELRKRPTDWRATLTPATVKLTELCIDARLRWVLRKRRRKVDWPPSVEELDAQIRDIERGLWRQSFRRWHEHYNAACAYALPLADVDDPDDATVARLADRAIVRLQKATARADSAYIASRRDWLVSQDPDLDGLRARWEFGHFEVMHLPSSSTTPRRPSHVQQLESSRYVRALLVATAEQGQTVWRRRRRKLNGGPDPRDLLLWARDELQTWEDVAAVAQHYRHSGTRLKLIKQLQACAERYGLDAPAVAFPRYEDDPFELSLKGEACGNAADVEIAGANARLEALRDILGENGEARLNMLADLEGWRSTLRRQDAAAEHASRDDVSKICDAHAALWQLLRQWLEADGGSEDDAQSEFREQREHARELWAAPAAQLRRVA